MTERGALLLEVMVALAVLAVVGSTAAWQASEAIGAVNRTHAREREMRAANRLLTAVSLWQRDDLDRHLGSTKQGAWRMRIDRPMATVYTVSIADSASGAVLLATSLFRKDDR